VPRILALRHAESTWNAQRRSQGWLDPPLTPEGKRKAAEAGGWIASHGIARVVSSDLWRAIDTARHIAAAAGIGRHDVDARLREREMGWWSGLTEDEIEAGWPGDLQRFRARLIDRPPGGEGTASLVARATAALTELCEADGDAPVLVVTHGGLIAALRQAAGTPWIPTRNLSALWVDVVAGAVQVDELEIVGQEKAS
jgi:broad specificity phosphatase PhoE